MRSNSFDTMNLETPLVALRGIGPRRAEALAAAGYVSVEDLLRHAPVRYEDRRVFREIRELAPDQGPACVRAEAVSSRVLRTRRRGFSLAEVRFRDATGELTAVWYNQPYVTRAFPDGTEVVLFGEPVARPRRSEPFVLENPDHVREETDEGGVHVGRVVPVYRKLGRLGSRALRTIIHGIMTQLEPTRVDDPVPADLLERWTLPSKYDALLQLHFPEEIPALDPAAQDPPWLRRLALEEIYLVQLALSVRREQRRRSLRALPDDAAPRRLPDLARSLLPYPLTADQRGALDDIAADLASGRPMGRLLQGDVGSGKTAVAVVAMARVRESGGQSALLAPTAVLAEQHHRRLRAILDAVGESKEIAILTGATRGRARTRILEEIATGRASIVVGTHALLDPAVRFDSLRLVVVDEQHRFGVAQRAALVSKSTTPHVLVMTATPIPRSLAMTLYGDLEISVIRELPPGRLTVRTVVRPSSARSRVYDGLLREIGKGHQAVVVVPRVDADEADDERAESRSAVRLAEQLQRGPFSDARVGVVHGRLPDREKHETMRAFENGSIDVLVSTTVIEVGIDVPNATVLVVEDAGRYGLSQLHQMRGRVGRGTAQGFCVLLSGDEQPGEAARERLAILERCDDGFEVSERDLALRGPGGMYTTQQHGSDDLRFLGVVLREPEMLEATRERARSLTRTKADVLAALETIPASWRRRLHLPDAG